MVILLRKLFRTAWKYKAQFLSMIIMVTIGVGVFIGFNMEWYSLQKNTDDYLALTNYADYRVTNGNGFSQGDVEAIQAIEGVKAATRVLNVNVDVKNSNNSLALFVPEEYTVSTMYLVKGEDYSEETNGFWLSDKYAEANGVAIGDVLTVTYGTAEIGAKVVGLVKSGEFMICVSGDNQIMPDYSTFGFAYATPNMVETALGFTFYPQIYVLSDMGKADMESAVTTALGKTTLVLSKAEHASYAGAQSEIEEGQTMVSVLPVLFLLIGVLTMITTMHRVTANEKTQIGTLKALGFRGGKISRHYTSYGLVIGLIGAVLGVALGIFICSLVISPGGMMATYIDLPAWKLYLPWWSWLILTGVVGFLTLISYLSVKKMLKGTAADALRPYTPKKVKTLAVEKTKAWERLSFATRWNLRDAFRHKTRSLMTLLGVIGCMVLLVGGLGMSDTMSYYLDTLDEEIMNYETRVNFSESVTGDEAAWFAAKYEGDSLSSTSVRVDGEAITLEIYDISHDTVRFLNKSGKTVSLENGGAYICLRLAQKGYAAGDTLTFSPYGSGESYSVKIIGVLRSFQSENIVMTTEYAKTISLSYTVSAVFTNVSAGGVERTQFVSSMQTKAAILDSYDGFMEVMNTMVLVFVLAAVVLGVVVLYNLGVMSYVERCRELATLKVVGFENKRIGRILIGQNIWLTVLGMLIGFPLGVGALYVLLAMLAGEYELKMAIGALTCCASVLLTFGVSLFVSVLVARKNKKINMVESLNGAE